MSRPPRTKRNIDIADDGDRESCPEGWEIEITGSDGAGSEDRVSLALDIILAAAVPTQE